MQVQFTGAETDTSELYNTVIDGEHILHNKMGKYINLYAAFDVYYINGNDVKIFHLLLKTKTMRLCNSDYLVLQK